MYLVLVAGASGSGKTTLVNLLNEHLEKYTQVHVLSMDQFYKSLNPGEKPDWDDVSAIDIEYLLSTLTALQKGESVRVPKYDYVTHQRIYNAYTIEKCDTLILEGIFTLCYNQLLELANLKVYVEAGYQVCLPRRFARDTAERGRSGESILAQYFDQVLPGFEKYVLPSKKYADICYPNEGEMPTVDSKIVKILGRIILEKI